MDDMETLTGRTAERNYAASNVTRLLCAGTYLDDGYRRAVIRELLIERYRNIAPSYGYDVVPVLGHALAAHRLRLLQSVTTIAAFLLFGLLWITGALGAEITLPLFLWTAWAATYLLRIVTLETLMHRLKSGNSGNGFDGSYPHTDRLSTERIDDLTEQQDADRGVIFYGGFTPFVGAGFEEDAWARAELLVEAPPNPFDEDDPEDGDDDAAAEAAKKGLIPFTVREITEFVARRLEEDLRDHAEPLDRIENLVVERRKFKKAISRTAAGKLDPSLDASLIHWEESYDAAREFLCVRIGSWEQELVTSMFVGFDIKGNNLHIEFHPYVLPPISQNFHLVDSLPDHFTPGLMFKVSFHALLALPGEILTSLLHPLANRLPNASMVDEKLDKKLAKGHRKIGAGSGGSLGLARYTNLTLDRGALHSVRELATPNRLHHFFQKSDLTKYTQVVQRSLMQNIGVFLKDHNVDLSDHRATQANILQHNYGDVNNYGPGNVNSSQGNRSKQTITDQSSDPAREEK